MGKGKFRDAQWCPFCGVKSLERDRSGEEKPKPLFKNEFHCTACGMGICIGPSGRYLTAAHLAKGMRQQRPPDKPPKERPADIELYSLQKYGEKIGLSGSIVRSTSKAARFNFLDSKGTCVGSMSYDRAMVFLRGYEISQRMNGRLPAGKGYLIKYLGKNAFLTTAGETVEKDASKWVIGDPADLDEPPYRPSEL